MDKLLTTMRRLRGPGGCPWDQEQTHESLRPYLLEEAAEAVDALSTGDPKMMADELGDVLLQVAFSRSRRRRGLRRFLMRTSRTALWRSSSVGILTSLGMFRSLIQRRSNATGSGLSVRSGAG